MCRQDDNQKPEDNLKDNHADDMSKIEERLKDLTQLEPAPKKLKRTSNICGDDEAASRRRTIELLGNQLDRPAPDDDESSPRSSSSDSHIDKF